MWLQKKGVPKSWRYPFYHPFYRWIFHYKPSISHGYNGHFSHFQRDAASRLTMVGAWGTWCTPWRTDATWRRPGLHTHIYVYYGGFHKCGISQIWMVYNGQSIYKWMIWGYPYFRKPPYIYIYNLAYDIVYSINIDCYYSQLLVETKLQTLPHGRVYVNLWEGNTVLLTCYTHTHIQHFWPCIYDCVCNVM